MDSNIDKVREALEEIIAVAGRQEDVSGIKPVMASLAKKALTALSAIDPKPAQNDSKPEANDNEQLDLVLKIRNDCTLDEALIAMQAFILYHDAELKRRIE